MATDLPTFEQRRLLVGIALLSAGLWLFIGFLALPAFLMAIPFSGILIALPLVWLLGDDFPLVESAGDENSSATEDPIESLQHRYSTGRIDEAEFERRLETLLESDEPETDELERDKIDPRSEGSPEYNRFPETELDDERS
ncbi:SHOCT domain-containing protein [Halostagnicola bangensis]